MPDRLPILSPAFSSPIRPLLLGGDGPRRRSWKPRTISRTAPRHIRIVESRHKRSYATKEETMTG
jgi:hypothetical protein